MSEKKITGTLRKVYTGLAVLAILALVVCSYYYYVISKEQNLQESNFRVLHRIEKNFEKRITDNRKLIIDSLKTCEGCISQGKIKPDSMRKAFLGNELFTFEDDSASSLSDWEIETNGKKSRIYFYIPKKELKDYKSAGSIKISADVEKILPEVLRLDVFPAYILAGKKGTAYNNSGEISRIPVTDAVLKNDSVTELHIGSSNFYVFSHPFSRGVNQDIVLSGIVPAQQYAHNKYGVPGNFLLTIFLLLLVILLAFPFIKSFLMSAEETLDTGDVLMALLSLFLLCYMYVFIHLNTYSVSRDEKDKREILKTTSDSIKNSFLAELTKMRLQLREYDSIFLADKDTIQKVTGLQPRIYPDFYRMFWLNKDGIQIGEFRKNSDKFSKPEEYNERDYHDRDYFKAVQNKALWYPEKADSDKIYLEPLYSRKDGSFRAILSKESFSPSVVAGIAPNMKSVINTIQPKEINFCVIDSKGNILFTSAGNEHLNENLPEECGYSKELISAIYARTNTFFDETFIGNSCSFYISPVNGLPLYVVTFANNEFTGSSQLQVGIFTSLFILAILIMFSLVILFILLLKGSNTGNMVKKPFLDLSTLYPSSNCIYRDFGGIFFNSLLMAALLVSAYICRNEPFTLIFLLLINASFTTSAFCYARVDLNSLKRKCFWAVTILFFILCDIFLSCLEAWENPFAMISVVCYELLLLWVIYHLRKMRYYEKDFKVFAGISKDPVYEKISITGKRYYLQNKIVSLQGKFSRFFSTKFYHQYSFMLVTWFLLIALLPSVFVYRYFYKNENENRIKSVQIDIAKQLYDKTAYKAGRDTNTVNPTDNSNIKSYLSGFYNTKLLTKSNCEDNPNLQETIFNNYLNHFRLSIISKDEDINANLTANSDSSIRFCDDAGKLSMSYQNLLNHPASQGNNTTVVQSTIPGFTAPGIRNFLPFVFYFLAPVIFLILLYFVIRFFLKRFFLFEVLPLEKQNNDPFFERLFYNYNNGTIQLIILGVTASGKKDIIRKALAYIYNQQNNLEDNDQDEEKQKERASFIKSHLFMYDLSETDQAIINFEKDKFKIKKDDIVVLNHFEHNLAEKATNDKKYILISKIFQMQKQAPHLVISSNIHPSAFLKNLKAKTNTESFKTEDYINKQDYYNWTGILSGFEIYTKAYQHQSQQTLAAEADDLIFYNAYKSKYTFYLSIWNSLDRIEKFVLYDLAKDNLVNYRNRQALYSLYCKGLVVQNDMPELVNEELRTFILSEINVADVELEKRLSGTGSAWNTFRIPFLMILVAVLLFVFITQQETFNKLMATLVAFAGCIPILLKLLATTSQTQEKKP